jgi:hypothetical protein
MLIEVLGLWWADLTAWVSSEREGIAKRETGVGGLPDRGAGVLGRSSST